MKGTKKFYKELVEEIRFHVEEIEFIKKRHEDWEKTNYATKVAFHEGAMRALRMVCYNIYPSCELDKDLKQGN